MTSLVAINQAMENAVHAMETTSWEHLKIGLGVGNPFIKQIVKVRGTLSGTYEKSNIVLPLYFRNIDKAMSVSLLRKNVRSNLYEKDYVSFLQDVRLLATNAEKYNGERDVVTKAAWELYNLAEKFDPFALDESSNGSSSSGSGSSSSSSSSSSNSDNINKNSTIDLTTITNNRRTLKKAPSKMNKSNLTIMPTTTTTTMTTATSKISHPTNSDNNSKKKSLGRLSKEKAIEIIKELAVNALRFAKDDKLVNRFKNIENNLKDPNFIDNIVNRTSLTFNIDDGYRIILNTWKNAIFSYSEIDSDELFENFGVKDLKQFLRFSGLPISGKKDDLCKRVASNIFQLQRDAWARGDVCVTEVLEIYELCNNHAKDSSNFYGSSMSDVCVKYSFKDPAYAKLANANILDNNINCMFCDSKSFRLGQIAKCYECKTFWHFNTCACNNNNDNKQQLPLRGFNKQYDTFITNEEINGSNSNSNQQNNKASLNGCCQQSLCITCRAKNASQMYLVKGMLCKPQILGKNDSIAKTFNFQLDNRLNGCSSLSSSSSSSNSPSLSVSTSNSGSRNDNIFINASLIENIIKEKRLGKDYEVWIRMFPLLLGNGKARYEVKASLKSNIRFGQKNMMLDLNDQTFNVRSKAFSTDAINNRFMKLLVHENGDLNITPFIKVDGNNIAKIALSSPIDNYRDEKWICIIQLVQKVSLEKIMDSVEARSFADGKEWIKNYFKKKSKDIEMPFVNMSLNCPLSTGRLVCPIRTATCKHLQCFDLETFWKYMTMMTKTNKKATCPICKAPASIADIRICRYTQQILKDIVSEDVQNAVITPDGSYRAKEEVKDGNNGSSSSNKKKRKRKNSDFSHNNSNNYEVIVLSSDDDEEEVEFAEDIDDDEDNVNIQNIIEGSGGNTGTNTLLPLSVAHDIVNIASRESSGSTYDDAIVLD